MDDAHTFSSPRGDNPPFTIPPRCNVKYRHRILHVPSSFSRRLFTPGHCLRLPRINFPRRKGHRAAGRRAQWINSRLSYYTRTSVTPPPPSSAANVRSDSHPRINWIFFHLRRGEEGEKMSVVPSGSVRYISRFGEDNIRKRHFRTRRLVSNERVWL